MPRVLVTGHQGYIGSVLVPMLGAAGYDVVGLDAGYFEPCRFGDADAGCDAPETVRADVRDLAPAGLPRCDAVVHLAALSNDALGALSPEITDEVNHRATVRLAELAREAGVERFVFSSSCSLYGASGGEGLLDEDAPFNPVTPYGRSKVDSEAGLAALADERFSPVYLRNATAYGVSPRLRGDLVVNELVARALLTGRVELNSDGSAWRPLAHVEDIARAVVAALEAPREAVHDRAFNVGSSEENYTIRRVAETVCAAVPGARVTLGAGAEPDRRSYRVSFERIAAELPDFRPRWTLARGVVQLLAAYRRQGITLEEVLRTRYSRIARLLALKAEGRLDDSLRWVPTLQRAG